MLALRLSADAPGTRNLTTLLIVSKTNKKKKKKKMKQKFTYKKNQNIKTKVAL